MSEFQYILYETERGRARITLNRPDKLNALSLTLQNELSEFGDGRARVDGPELRDAEGRLIDE